ncbi:MAG TPA: glycosyltransferase [Acidimicrobiales bacterium]|nr:glycosyltransferase [Acidimicrobiales bacterium]
MARRVAYILRYFPKLSETFIVEEIAALAEAGLIVSILARSDAGEPVVNPRAEPMRGRATWLDQMGRRHQLRLAGGVLVRHPIAGLRATLLALRQKSRLCLANLFYGLVLAAEATRRGFDLLHAHFADTAGEMAFFASLVSGIPYSLTIHATDIYNCRMLCREIRHAALTVTVCRYNIDQIVQRCPDVDPGKLMVKYAGVDPQLFRRSSPPAERTHDRVLSIGRLVDKKGFPVLLEALGRLRAEGRNTTCLIVGEGDQRPELEERIRSLGLEAAVELPGWLPPEQIRQEMERADVLVCPSTLAGWGDRDSMPVVVKEAMAMELPVVASADFGIPEMVEPETGILVPRDDPDALSQAVARILDMTLAERHRMGRAGRAVVIERFNERAGAVELARRYAAIGS